MRHLRVATIGLFAALLFGGCTCADEARYSWQLDEFSDLGIPDEPDADRQIEPDDSTPSLVETDEVEPAIPIEQALNERTALATDPEGTIWLGYHSCPTNECSDPVLTLASKPLGQDWRRESVISQRGTFGIEVTSTGEVIAAFLDPGDFTFKTARRLGPDQFTFFDLPVRRGGRADGLDLAPDSGRMFVTFAGENDAPVRLFVFNDGQWSGRKTLEIRDASAALERGLRADGDGNLYLVHQRGRTGEWGIARYRLNQNRWDDPIYYREFEGRPSSLVVRANGEICLAGADPTTRLQVVCGPFEDIEQDLMEFDERTDGRNYLSMVEGPDEQLHVVFVAQDGILELATRRDGAWLFEKLFDGPAFGVSTAINPVSSELVVSYYSCGTSSCTIEVLERAP